ncbi:MAG TPA: hypothetical protein VGI81_11480 [Tepidisphaeraceae bacterium]|jgi:hypothetical protein
MTRELGCKFEIAPHFELPADWQERLLIGAGVEECDGGFFPHGPWRSPDAGELSQLVAGQPNSNTSDDKVELFKLPAHLCAQWWQLLGRTGDASTEAGRLPGYDAFLAQIADFLTFKSLAINDPVSCDVVVTRPGQRSVRWDPAEGHPLGLGCTIPPQTPCTMLESQSSCRPRLWGAINLGDEATSFVLIAPPCRAMTKRLRRDFPDRASPATLGALIEQFLRSCPDVSPVRVTLHPGEGLRLPGEAMLVDGFPHDKREPDVLLLITESRLSGPT